MENPGLPVGLWHALNGRLWHATSPQNLVGIMRDGEIRVFMDRYREAFCKTLGGISLMDFGPSATDGSGQLRNWRGWFGREQGCRVAVWIEIDRQAIKDCLLDAETARIRERKDARGGQIIPGVEACHCGPIPAQAFAGILCIDQHDLSRFEKAGIDEVATCAETFEALLPAPPPVDPLAALLQERRAQKRL